MFFLSASSASTSSFVSAVAAIIVANSANEPQSRRVHNALTDEVDFSRTKWFSIFVVWWQQQRQNMGRTKIVQVLSSSAMRKHIAWMVNWYPRTQHIPSEWAGKMERKSESTSRFFLLGRLFRCSGLPWIHRGLRTWSRTNVCVSFFLLHVLSLSHSAYIQSQSSRNVYVRRLIQSREGDTVHMEEHFGASIKYVVENIRFAGIKCEIFIKKLSSLFAFALHVPLSLFFFHRRSHNIVFGWMKRSQQKWKKYIRFACDESFCFHSIYFLFDYTTCHGRRMEEA